MPIKPERKKLYPSNWKQIVSAVRERSGNMCELCALHNGDIVQRCKRYPQNHYPVGARLKEEWGVSRPIRVVLTVAHINQDPTDNRPENLLHLCQRCHNRIDLPYRMENAARPRGERKGKRFFEDGKP